MEQYKSTNQEYKKTQRFMNMARNVIDMVKQGPRSLPRYANGRRIVIGSDIQPSRYATLQWPSDIEQSTITTVIAEDHLSDQSEST